MADEDIVNIPVRPVLNKENSFLKASFVVERVSEQRLFLFWELKESSFACFLDEHFKSHWF